MTQEKSGFDTFGLDPRVNIGVRAAGYEQPTPIQEQTIAEGMTGRHILGLAQTGTGKTAAFVLPILHRLLETGGSTAQAPKGQRHGGRGTRRKTRALVIAPTRELAEQINDEFRTLGQATGLKSATVYGGVGFQPQIEALRGRADIIVACPGRLIDHMERRVADLTNVEILVLDEADHMFDMGFLPPIRRILQAIPDGAQRMLFSATMPSEVAHLADEVLTDPLKVAVDHSAPAETIEHALMAIDEKVKTDLLLHMLKSEDHRSTLVFTRTKHRAKKLAEKLDSNNIFVAEIQGNLSQRRRQEALDGFKDGTFHVLVATDIAARGIDVARVSHVINFDFPDTPEAYTHRIGRTGRARRSGKAITFVTEYDFGNVQQLERKLGMRINRERTEGFAGPVDALENLRPGGRGGKGGPRGGNRSGGRAGGRSGGQGRSFSGGQASGARSEGKPSYGERAAASEPRSYGDRNRIEAPRTEGRTYGNRTEGSSYAGSSRTERGAHSDRPRTEKRGYGQRPSGESARTEGRSYGDRNRTEGRSYSDRPRTENRTYGKRAGGDTARSEGRSYGNRADAPRSEGRNYGSSERSARRPDRGDSNARPANRSYGQRPSGNRSGGFGSGQTRFGERGFGDDSGSNRGPRHSANRGEHSHEQRSYGERSASGGQYGERSGARHNAGSSRPYGARSDSRDSRGPGQGRRPSSNSEGRSNGPRFERGADNRPERGEGRRFEGNRPEGSRPEGRRFEGKRSEGGNSTHGNRPHSQSRGPRPYRQGGSRTRDH